MHFHANKLLVEGGTDQRVIPYLMEHNGVMWPEPPPVFIKDFGGVDEILKPGVVEAEFKESRLEAYRVLDPTRPESSHFVTWFRNLYRL